MARIDGRGSDAGAVLREDSPFLRDDSMLLRGDCIPMNVTPASALELLSKLAVGGAPNPSNIWRPPLVAKNRSQHEQEPDQETDRAVHHTGRPPLQTEG